MNVTIKIFLISIFCILSNWNLLAQNSSIDSSKIEELFSSKMSPIELVDSLNELAFIEKSSKSVFLKPLLDSIIVISLRNNYSEGLSTGYVRLGDYLKYNNKEEESLFSYRNSLNIAINTNNQLHIGRAQGQIAQIYYRMNKIDSAIFHVELAELVYRKLKEIDKLAQVLNKKGNYFRKLKGEGSEIKALIAFHESLSIRQKSNSTKIVGSYINLGLFYEKSYPDSSIFYFQKVYDFGPKNKYLISKTFALLKLSKLFRFQNNFQKAKSRLLLADNLILSYGINDSKVLNNHFFEMSNSFPYLTKPDSLFVMITDTLIPDVDKIPILINIGKYYLKKNELKDATIHFDLADSLLVIHQDINYQFHLEWNKLEMFLVENNQSERLEGLKLIKTKYFQDHQKLIEASIARDKYSKLQKELELNANKLRYTRIILIISIFTSFLFFLYLRSRNKKRKVANELEETLQQQDIKILEAHLDGGEEEKSRLAKDIHDKVSANLAMVKRSFSSLKEKCKIEKTEFSQEYQKALEYLGESYDDVRNIAHQLEYSTLKNQGLTLAIRDLKLTVESSSNLKIDLHEFGLENRLSRLLETQLFLMVNEMLQNTLKHANAKELSISFTRLENTINLVVEDDGVGMNLEQNVKGIGLKNIQDRVNKLQGKITIESYKNRGTTFLIDLPIKDENHD